MRAVAPLHAAGGEWSEWHDDADALYRSFADLGVRFGPSFRTLERWRVGRDAAEGWLTGAAPDTASRRADGVSPTLLDGALQLCVLAATTADGVTPGAVLLPLAVEAYSVLGSSPDRVRAEVRVRRHGAEGTLVATVRLFARGRRTCRRAGRRALRAGRCRGAGLARA